MVKNAVLRSFVRSFVVCAAASMLMAAAAWAQTAGHTKLNVKGRVQLEIPEDWTIQDAEHRKRIRDDAAKLTGLPINHASSLSVHSFPAPSRVLVRVSFIPLDPPITQADLRREVLADRQQVLRDVAETWRADSPKMWEALAKNGIKEVGRSSVAVEPLGGQTAMVIRYARTSTVDPTETMKVAQYHVVLGSEKALITLSYIEGDKAALASHDRLKSSIAVR
jgi:hypothetical protein